MVLEKAVGISNIKGALEDLRQGKMIILVDDEDRENEGDLTMIAEKVTPEAINFMAKYARGLICLALHPDIVERLKLPLMVHDNQSRFQTAFTVSIEAKNGVTTGISAADRAHTILTAVADDAKPDDLVQPGHLFPLRARRGGVLFRTGQTEGSVDLARLAGLKPAAVICEIMNEDGTMARRPDLDQFAKKHGLRIVTVADIIAYRMRNESFVHKEAETILPTPYGEFKAVAFINELDNSEHLALIKGEIEPNKDILVRVHSECLTGDVFGSYRCDCGDQLKKSLKMINQEGLGVVVYLRQEGRGIGFANKLKAYALQDKGFDTVEANKELGFKPDLRDYGVGAQILVALGVRRMRIMTNNPKKIIGLDGYGLTVTGRVPIEITPRPENVRYLLTKCEKLGHIMSFNS
ncbi:MAG: bifunctional 3,4-dihydroxy-2-butanone-4-phosphate synthase/GTP cyclohydrolase II [Deltaproteobacteria bacterium]|nr:bifunctional 3,4-dihydroxy-2-butanone-4-phosphate synthase/GTP cyclohydrolase II [Deltaproteobacteria bacterium]MBW2105418.1 bifunctional 3,4-dihydroxy-2-butanone-4-phosphate synthase/GTP cyclohydrolase II [Deltaproteobacteria bacterium]MBW2333188.1 bifunctional 3,4-dihydroxy-2-butanone-4-phosphate synthase/GTP cyclohydrolase II [Deltaproteobacteria bacterium]